MGLGHRGLEGPMAQKLRWKTAAARTGRGEGSERERVVVIMASLGYQGWGAARGEGDLFGNILDFFFWQHFWTLLSNILDFVANIFGLLYQRF